MAHLILFFTYGVSLQTWAKIGILDREIALYRKYVKAGWRVSFVTYGGREDLELQDRLDRIEILCNRWDFPRKFYVKYLPFLYASKFANADVIKSNQLKGAEIAWRVARYWKKPFVFRCGYLQSAKLFLIDESSLDDDVHDDRHMDRHIEREVFPAAQRIIVTSEIMKRYIVEKYSVAEESVKIIPNFVQTDIFKPDETKRKFSKISCVARLLEVKNLVNLIQACKANDLELDLIGGGPLEGELKALAADTGARVNFLGIVPNTGIPDIINSSSIFALVSKSEGNPKALLEAMSCGLPVIGSDVTGIRDVIRHMDNGYLCGLDSDSIRSAIQRLMGDENLRRELGKNARNFVENNYSFEKVFAEEYDLINRVIREYAQANKIVRNKLHRFASYCQKIWVSIYILFPILFLSIKINEQRGIMVFSRLRKNISRKPEIKN